MKRLFIALVILFIPACGSSRNAFSTATIPVPIMATSTTERIIALSPTPQATDTPLPQTTLSPTEIEVPRTTQAALTKLQPGENVTLTSIQMLDSENGWALESKYHILHTQDGGNTWQDVTPPQGTYLASGFFASDSKTAWATFFTGLNQPIPSAFVWYTLDGGQSWQASQPFPVNLDREGKDVPNDYYRPQQLYFVDRQTGWLLVDVYYGMHSTRLLLFRTQDGGKTWAVINDHYHDLHKAAGIGVAFINPEEGWYGQNDIRFQWISLRIDEIIETGGWKLPKTLNGGRSFTEFTLLPLPAELRQPQFAGESADCGETRMLTIAPSVIGVEWTCWIYTQPRQDYSFYALTGDNGQSWHSWLATGNEFFLNAQTGWRLSTTANIQQLQQTSDGGINWLPVKSVAWQAAQFDFVSEQVGWAIVQNDNATAFIRTTDAGKTWAEISPVITQ